MHTHAHTQHWMHFWDAVGVETNLGITSSQTHQFNSSVSCNKPTGRKPQAGWCWIASRLRNVCKFPPALAHTNTHTHPNFTVFTGDLANVAPLLLGFAYTHTPRPCLNAGLGALLPAVKMFLAIVCSQDHITKNEWMAARRRRGSQAHARRHFFVSFRTAWVEFVFF